ncbi:alternative ribosome rescue aminoacyl-tRNA hydrolase ArfB [Ulvibacter litoralis]|uniref:Ribosome-associated protein n=1 Tax=Ulvibacter litoralis TaxID=227084 RepID=A0A1G7CV45_9FLAO|nr:alternative ribosome rescue aminoacyl-tRNA hydrolase ArfB [Ulvibacter litoralis]GHC46124.1 aminoacyl-tRNA hydrolase [Ulvibacter litoralis]SDE42630.1 ribosome-associated protein [Ulvibacter litoralis]
MELDTLYRELAFKAVRSSGPGGQHVNKTATKIELSFSIVASEAFTELEKERLQEKLSNRISQDGILSLQCGETRSQHRNKAIVIERLVTLLKDALKVAKPRKKSKPSKSAIERRLRSKKGHALKKANRKPPSID